MIVKEFLSIYKSDGIVQHISEQIQHAKPGQSFHIQEQSM
jgi:hypothetical protein